MLNLHFTLNGFSGSARRGILGLAMAVAVSLSAQTVVEDSSQQLALDAEYRLLLNENGYAVLNWNAYYYNSNNDSFPALSFNADVLGDLAIRDGDLILRDLAATPGAIGVDNNGRIIRLPNNIIYSESGLTLTANNSYPYDPPLAVIGNASITGTISAGVLKSSGAAVVGNGALTLTSFTTSSNSAATYTAGDGSTINSYSITTTLGSVQFLDLVPNATGTNSSVIRFLTKSTSSVSAPIERARIDASGKLGVGTSSPVSLLSVSGSAAIGTYAPTNAAPSNGLIVSGSMGVGTYSPASKLAVSGGVSIGSAYTASASPSNGLIVSGLVGINTATPSSASSNQLDVNGGAIVRGTLRVRAGGNLSMGSYTSSNGLNAP